MSESCAPPDTPSMLILELMPSRIGEFLHMLMQVSPTVSRSTSTEMCTQVVETECRFVFPCPYPLLSSSSMIIGVE